MTILKAYQEDRKLRRAYIVSISNKFPDDTYLDDPEVKNKLSLIGKEVAIKHGISPKELDDFIVYAVDRWTNNFINYLNLNE